MFELYSSTASFVLVLNSFNLEITSIYALVYVWMCRFTFVYHRKIVFIIDHQRFVFVYVCVFMRCQYVLYTEKNGVRTKWSVFLFAMTFGSRSKSAFWKRWPSVSKSVEVSVDEECLCGGWSILAGFARHLVFPFRFATGEVCVDHSTRFHGDRVRSKSFCTMTTESRVMSQI